MQNYQQLLEKISKASNLSIEDIERRIEGKRAKLSGLVSKEGAAQIVAAELGINFEKQKVKVNELVDGIRRVNISGKIIQLFPVREFKKENREGKVVNFVIADETGNVRVVLWDTNHIKLVENKEVKEGDVVEISNAQLRNNEIHLTGFSDIKLSQEVIDNVKMEKTYFDKKLAELKKSENARVRAFVVQAFPPRFFEVCPQCNSRARLEGDMYLCVKHGRVVPEKRALLSVILDDGSENLRAVLFSEQIKKMGVNVESFDRDGLLGKEAFFAGTMRENKLFNSNEFFVNNIEEINIEELIGNLEKGAQ